MTAFFTIFQRIPTISQRFPKILQNLFKGHMNVAEHFSSEDKGNMPLESWMWFRMNFTSGVFSSKTLMSV